MCSDGGREGGTVWGIVRTFGLVSAGAGLLSVRGADRGVKGCVGVAQDRGEDIRRSQVSARDEPQGPPSQPCYHKTELLRVPACATGCVGRASVEGAVLAGSTRQGFARPSAAEAQADRVDVLLGMRAHPRVINLGISQVPAVAREPPRALLLVHSKQASLDARVHASGYEGLDLQPFPGQEVLVVPITIVRSGASRMSRRGSGLILHGVLGPREDVAPRSARASSALSRRGV